MEAEEISGKGRIVPTTLDWRRTQFSIHDTMSSDLRYISIQLKQTWANLKTVQRKAGQIRTSYLKDLAEHLTEKNGSTSATEIKNTSHMEVVCQTA